MFEKFREALESVLDAATRPDDGEALRSMHQAVVEAKTSLSLMEEGIDETARQLQNEKRQLQDTERRCALAKGIGDTETVEIAERFSEKHRERIVVVERKLKAQRAELALAHREFAEMKEQLKAARAKLPRSGDRVEAAWREIESAGGTRPDLDLAGDILKSQLERAQREANAQARLEQLKKKMGR